MAIAQPQPTWARRLPDGSLQLALHVQPGARRTEVAGTHGDRIKVRVAAPAVDDKANTVLVRFVAGRLGVRSRDVEITAGARSRTKTLSVAPPAAADVDIADLTS